MKHPIRMFALALAAGLLLTSGCGKQDSDTPRFNQTLGDSTAGVPIGTGPIDEGILKDTKSYQPADYEPLVETQETGGGVAAGSADEGEEAQAIRTVLHDGVLSLTDFDLAGILDAFPEKGIAALRSDACIDAANSFVDTIKNFFEVVKAKAGPDAPGADIDIEALTASLADALLNTVSIQVLDEQTATATFNLSRFEMPEDVSKQIDEVMAAMAGGEPNAPADAGNAAAAAGMSPDAILAMVRTATFDLPFRKTEDGWRVDVPIVFEEEHAELLAEGFEIMGRVYGDLTQRVSAMEEFSPEAMQTIAQQAQMQHMGEIMGWVGRAQMAAMSLAEQLNAGGDNAAPAGEDEGEAETEAESPAVRPGTEADPNGG